MAAEPYTEENGKDAYLGLADEMNDVGIPPWNESDWDPQAVKDGKRYAKEHGFRWPPSTGDYDRWWDIENNEGHES